MIVFLGGGICGKEREGRKRGMLCDEGEDVLEEEVSAKDTSPKDYKSPAAPHLPNELFPQSEKL